MDDRQVETGEEERRGVPEGFEEEEEREQAGVAQEGEDRSTEGGLRRQRRKERKEMEMSSFGSSPSQGLVGAMRRFLEGELVEVRQREKGLRGSWHPAVVIGVKSGRRVVEYDELLTDDGCEKLTENIPVGRCLDGGRLGAGRPPWKYPAKRPRTLLRPRPPPLPDPSSISWSKGLSVDCYFKDAWWEGVLTEAINSSSRQKRALVWFPEEEDWEAMPLKDMRVGQQWDEDTGSWSLKGCVDLPSSKGVKGFRTMSLSQKSRGFTRNHLRNPVDRMELDIALKIDGTSSSRRDVEYTSAWNSIDRTKDHRDAVISVQLNSPRSSAFTPPQAGTDRSSGDLSKEQKHLPLALRTRSSDSSPRQLRSPRGRSREESVFVGRSSGEENDNAASFIEDGEDQEGLVNSGEMVYKENSDDDKLTISRERRCLDVGNGHATQRLGNLDILNNFSPEEQKDARQLLAAGWRISRKKTKARNLYYRSPNGCLLGSLASALGMWRRMKEYKNNSFDDENPTLSDILSPNSGKGSPFSKGRFGSGRTLKGSRRGASPTSVKEGGHEMDQLGPRNVVHVNGNMVSNLGLPAGSNGAVRSSNPNSMVSLLSNLSSKRNALESELISDDGKLIELKRRKMQDSAVEQNGPSSLRTTLSNVSPIQWCEGVAGGGLSLEKSPLTESKPVGLSLSLDDDGLSAETRSKKRVCLTDGIKLEQGNEFVNTKSTDDRSPFRDSSIEYEPKSKKSRVLTEASTPSEGKSRKSLAILQESSRKKGSTPHKAGDWKQAKKSTTQVKKSASHVKKGKKSRAPARPGVRLEVLLAAPGSNPTVGDGELRRKRTLLSWLIDNGTVSEHEKVRYLHRIDHHCMNEGYVTRDGILCNCCKRVVTLSVFEAHAGSKLHRPSANIFLDDGRSISVCQVEALAVKQGQTDKGFGELDKSDDTCGVCGDGGELICCDHCPSTFHITCMGLQEVPDGDWYCPNCRCASCGDSQFNGDKTTFNDLTVIFCDQCECEYHVKCLRARGLSLSSPPQEDFFCGDSCGRIFQGLRNLVGICKPMEGGFSWTLLRSAADDDGKSGCISNAEINAEHDSKLSIALSVMQECFRPMIDPRTKIDIITHVLYNKRSDVSRLNYHGFYTMLLERGDELISVATIRVHGARLAEMPLIGTRFQYRRQGMCRRLMSAIEEMLYSLGVERLVLPAVPELLETWTGAFGFQPMDESERLQLMDLNIMAFPGTSILYKRLEDLALRSGEALLSTVDQSRCAEIGQARLQKEYPDASLALPPVIGKRGRGRPPKVKGEITNWNNGHALALTEAIVGHTTRHSESTVSSQCVTLKRGPGRPPKNSKALFKQSDREKLARKISMAIVGAHQLAEGDCDAGYTCSPSQEFLGKGFGVTKSVKGHQGHQEEKEPMPTVLRRKRGRPPRARMSYNPGTGILTTSTPIQVDQVAGYHGGEGEMEATRLIFPVRSDGRFFRSTNGRYASPQGRGDDECSNSAIVPKTTRSMREVKTPMWLVESVNTLTRERSCKTLAIEGPSDISPLESSITGSTRTYERRKSGLSPPSQSEPPSRIYGDGSEPTYGHRDFFDEDDDPVEPGLSYEAVSVPIRTFPSQFASRGDHSTPPGTFIPVETIVVNSQPKVETLDELLVPGCEEELGEPSSLSERGEQKSGGKLLLRLKLPKRKTSPDDLELPQQSPPMALKLPNGGLLPPPFTVPDQISKEVNRFEQLDQEQLKQPESTMGSHCIPVRVS